MYTYQPPSPTSDTGINLPLQSSANSKPESYPPRVGGWAFKRSTRGTNSSGSLLAKNWIDPPPTCIFRGLPSQPSQNKPPLNDTSSMRQKRWLCAKDQKVREHRLSSRVPPIHLLSHSRTRLWRLLPSSSSSSSSLHPPQHCQEPSSYIIKYQ